MRSNYEGNSPGLNISLVTLIISSDIIHIFIPNLFLVSFVYISMSFGLRTNEMKSFCFHR